MRTAIDSVLEGRCGHMFVAGDSGAAWALEPPFWFPVGPEEDVEVGRFFDAIEALGGVVVGSAGWLDRVAHRCADRAERLERTSFSAAGLSVSRLGALAEAGDPGCELARISAQLAGDVVRLISPHLVRFPSSEAFEREGIGFCLLRNGEPVAAASSALVSKGAIEVQVNTQEAHRGRGYATRVSAALLSWCLQHGLTPNWDTGDPISNRLAHSLGYVPSEHYVLLEVAPPAS